MTLQTSKNTPEKRKLLDIVPLPKQSEWPEIRQELAEHTVLIHEIFHSGRYAHFFGERCGEALELHAVFRLRTGCLFHLLKDSLPHGRFERVATELFPGIPDRTRRRYMQDYTRFSNEYTKIAAAEANDVIEIAQDDEEEDDDDDALELAENSEDGTLSVSQSPRKEASLTDILGVDTGIQEICSTLYNDRRLRSIYSKIKQAVGDRSITSIARDTGTIPDLKKKQGKPRGGKGAYKLKKGGEDEPSTEEIMCAWLSAMTEGGEHAAIRRILTHLARKSGPEHRAEYSAIFHTAPAPLS